MVIWRKTKEMKGTEWAATVSSPGEQCWLPWCVRFLGYEAMTLFILSTPVAPGPLIEGTEEVCVDRHLVLALKYLHPPYATSSPNPFSLFSYMINRLGKS